MCVWLRQSGGIFGGAPEHGREALCAWIGEQDMHCQGTSLLLGAGKSVWHPLVMEWDGEEWDKL